jgi:hypothetical protein
MRVASADAKMRGSEEGEKPMSAPGPRNLVCPITEATCVDPRCKTDYCAQVNDEEARRQSAQTEEDNRFIKGYGLLAWKAKQIKLKLIR